jgi:hypothetical protein
VEVWGFIWLMLVLKIPVAAMLWLVWWSVQPPEPAADDEGDGGSGTPRAPHPHDGPRAPRPRTRPRGPHGDPTPPAPPRSRTPARAPRTPVR